MRLDRIADMEKMIEIFKNMERIPNIETKLLELEAKIDIMTIEVTK